jgi:malic enzyme
VVSAGVRHLITENRCIDKSGLLLKSQGNDLTPAQIPFAREEGDWQGGQHYDLLSVIQQAKPHVLIGTSTKPKAFTEKIIREMARLVDRPIVFPLSNPTRLHEAQPQDLYEWTDGKALVATGSPFPPVKYGGVEYDIGEFRSSPIPILELVLIQWQRNAIILPVSQESASAQSSREAVFYQRRC